MVKKVVVAMSGGVDSSVTAALLKEKGYEVVGLFMHNGVSYENKNTKSCCSLRDAHDARDVAYQLNIKFYSLDLSKEFANIMNYFVNEYLEGRTPSPCVKCNSYLKFGVLLNFAQLIGAEFVATGHYAKIVKKEKLFQIKEGADKNKDQSYFLFELSQKQLSQALLPLGDFTKQEVRKLAEKFSLKTASKEESQDLCFIPDGDLKRFLKNKLPNSKNIEGYFVDTDGNRLGKHDGYIYYTIGQRKGLGVARGIPLYVNKVNPQTKEVVLGQKCQIMSKKMLVEKVNFCSVEPYDAGSAFEAQVKIRYKHPKSPAKIKVLNNNEIEVEFKEPQPAITPGQAACFYNEDTLLGGGWIKSVIDYEK